MQKFERKLKNTPRNASQVSCSVNLMLNKDESPSASDGLKNDKLISNNPEVNRRQHTGGQNLRVSDIVYVLNLRGQPLMPTKHKKAKWLRGLFATKRIKLDGKFSGDSGGESGQKSGGNPLI